MITTLISNYEVILECRYEDVSIPVIWLHWVRYGALCSTPSRDTKLRSCMANSQYQLWSPMRSQLIVGEPDSHSHNADTTHLEAAWDMLSAVEWSLLRGITVPDSQQHLMWTVTVLEVQELSSVKCIHQQRRLQTVKSGHSEVMANAHSDESERLIAKWPSPKRSQLHDGNSEIHSCWSKSNVRIKPHQSIRHLKNP